MQPVDLVLVEGYKTHPFPKLEVYRPALGKPPIWPDQADIVAVASDVSVSTDRKLLPLNDPPEIAEWLLGEGWSSHGLI
jgi:molybdopterin-guanine dinucleotide biosynthesis protein B